MTAYFDDFATELAALAQNAGAHPYDALYAIERRLVDDCLVTAMAPEFPADLRYLLLQTVLLKSVVSQPRELPPQHIMDFETTAEHFGVLRKLASELHTIFHGVAADPDCPFGDHPRSWWLTQRMHADERLAQMAEALSTEVHPSPHTRWLDPLLEGTPFKAHWYFRQEACYGRQVLHDVLYLTLTDGHQGVEYRSVSSPMLKADTHASLQQEVKDYIQASEPERRAMRMSNVLQRHRDQTQQEADTLSAQLERTREEVLHEAGLLSFFLWDIQAIRSKSRNNTLFVVLEATQPDSASPAKVKVHIDKIYRLLGFSYHSSFEGKDFVLHGDDGELTLSIEASRYQEVVSTLGLTVVSTTLKQQWTTLDDEAVKAVRVRDEAKAMLEQIEAGVIPAAVDEAEV